MVIFWRGFGILAAILMGVVYFGSLTLADKYVPGHDWTWLMSSWLAAAAVYGLDVGLRKYQEFDDPRPRHDFMFIPLRGWVIFLLCWGVYVYFMHK